MKRYKCQECGGRGEYIEEYLDGRPRYEHCGWCAGTGYVSGSIRSRWLNYKKSIKRKKKNLEILKKLFGPEKNGISFDFAIVDDVQRYQNDN